MSKHTYKSGELDMQCNKRAEALFDKAKKLGMINHSTGDGAPNCAMLADALLCMESDAQIAIVCETSTLRARLAVADAALAEARGLVEFLNKPLPVNSRAALVERCYQVQLICETIPPHENQTKTAIALSELVTAIRESGGRDETLADLAKAREDAAGFQADLQSVQRENAALREAGDRLFRHAGVLVKYKNNQEKALWENLCNGINAWDGAIQGVALAAALHPATKEGKA